MKHLQLANGPVATMNLGRAIFTAEANRAGAAFPGGLPDLEDVSLDRGEQGVGRRRNEEFQRLVGVDFLYFAGKASAGFAERREQFITDFQVEIADRLVRHAGAAEDAALLFARDDI